MKRFFGFAVMVALLSFITSCDFDDARYSSNNEWVGFGLINHETGSETFTIAMDDGELLFPTVYSKLISDFKNNDRVLINFAILGNKENSNHDEQYYVEINSLRKILYKAILDITPAIEDSIGNDPIKISDHWIKNNMLNFELQYRGGSKIHYINLVKQPGIINTDNGPVILELRHNNNNDKDQIPLSAIVTFDLGTLKVSGKTSTPFKVIAKGFDGDDFEYTGEYKY